ncbi:MAG: hypothetical protein WCO09_03600 [bacterium]
MKKILFGLAFIFIMLGTTEKAFATTASYAISIDSYPRSESSEFMTNVTSFDSVSDYFRIMFKKSTDPACANNNSIGWQDNVILPAYNNISVSQISASLISSSGQKTSLPAVSTNLAVGVSRSGSCTAGVSQDISHLLLVSSSPARQIPEGLYTFELCVDGVCTQVPNVRLKNSSPLNFGVAYFPNTQQEREYDLSSSSTKALFVLPNIRLPYATSTTLTIYNNLLHAKLQSVYIGANGQYSLLGLMGQYTDSPISTLGSAGTSYSELFNNMQFTGPAEYYFPDITKLLKAYKDGTYTIVSCLNSAANMPDIYRKFSDNKSVFCATKTLRIKNSSGTKVPGGEVLPYGLTTITTSSSTTTTAGNNTNTTSVATTSTQSASSTSTGSSSSTNQSSTSAQTPTTSSSTLKIYTLKSSVVGSGKITGGKSKYKDGAMATLTAVPSRKWTFTSWGGDCVDATGTVCSIVVNENKTISVTFTKNIATTTASITPPVSSTTGKTCYVNNKIYTGKDSWKKVSCTSSTYKNFPSNMKKALDTASSSSSVSTPVSSTSSSASTSNQSASATTAITNTVSNQNNSQVNSNPIVNVWQIITGFFR